MEVVIRLVMLANPPAYTREALNCDVFLGQSLSPSLNRSCVAIHLI